MGKNLKYKAPPNGNYSVRINTYTLFWKNGKREVLNGTDVIKAIREAGYETKDLTDLSFFTPGNNTEYRWVESSRTWVWQL